MASRKMTFTLPEDVAEQFVRRVSARDRSRYVAEALMDRLAARDRQLLRSCEIANKNADASAIEQEFDAVPSEVTEPWTDARAR